MPRTRILIADDHALVRAGLRALLATEPDLEVVGEADDGVVVVEKCRQLAANMVLLDLSMPGRGGIATIQDLRHSCPEVKVLVVTMHEDEAFARQALLAGAAGYVLKRSLATELLTAIRAVRLGKQHIAPSLREAVAGLDRAPECPSGKENVLESLTPREREVVHLIALGHTNSEIAQRLLISQKTVGTHRHHISAQLGVRTRADLVRFAIEYGLMSD